ncbi:MAG: OmpW family outer membrane protein, partial [Thermoanaerobaculia bacterium]
MQKTIVAIASLLFVVGSAFAQDAARSNSITVFAPDLEVDHSDSWTRVSYGYGASLAHMFKNRVSAELSVTHESVGVAINAFLDNGVEKPYRLWTTVYPVDASVSYHFLTNSRWKPYLGAGLRYASFDFSSGGVAPVRVTERNFDTEVSGGVVFQFRPNFGLRFDAKQILGNTDN